MRWKQSEFTGWGRVLKRAAVASREDRLKGLQGALAERSGPAVGNFRSYGDAALAPILHVTSRMDRILKLDTKSGILEAEAGLALGTLLEILLPHGWMPPVLPGTGFATLGGAVAMDVHGKNHHSIGSIGQHIRSLTVIGPDGTPKRISNARNKDLFRATIGGAGQTGIITQVEMALLPAPSAHMRVTETRIDNLSDFIAALEASEAPFAVGWIDVTAHGSRQGRGILEEAEIADSTAPLADKKRKTVPFNAPNFALSHPVVKLFNAAYFNRVPALGRTRTRPMPEFFFPLDAIHDWNKLYGKRGFHQFQCVLPEDRAEAVIAEMLDSVLEARIASPLAVIKKMGPAGLGQMSFPMAGITLALDFPASAKAEALIKRLIGLTVEAGGRIYLAKDSLAAPDDIRAMYPERSDWAKIVNAHDPDHSFATDLAARLNLRGAS